MCCKKAWGHTLNFNIYMSNVHIYTHTQAWNNSNMQCHTENINDLKVRHASNLKTKD